MTAARKRAITLRGGTAGFTLVEMMIAMTILAIGILGAGRLFVFSQSHSTHGREETTAATLAQEIREKILSEPYGTIQANFDGIDTANPESLSAPCLVWYDHVTARLGVEGRGTIEVFTHLEDDEIVDGMLTILVTMIWQEQGVPQSLELRFSRTRLG